MNKTNYLWLTILWCSFTTCCFAQEPFTNCTASFLDNKIIVDEYSPNGKCSLPATAMGKLTVCTADLSPTQSFPVKQIKFMVALRDQNTKTLTMFSNETYKQIDIHKVLARCRKGDSIVLITMDDQYAFPHNEILVQ